MQRDYYLPLKVIRGYLDDLDAGREPCSGWRHPRAARRCSPATDGSRRDELIKEAGATPMLLGDAVTASLIVAAEHYGDDALSVLRALVELQRSGIEPRHLRGFRAAAERELGLIESALIPVARRKDASSRAKALDMAGEIAGHSRSCAQPDPVGAEPAVSQRERRDSAARVRRADVIAAGAAGG